MEKEGIESYWAMPSEKVIKRLGSSETGLSSDEARKRLEKYGPNEVAKTKKKNILIMFIEQFKNPFILLLVIAILLSYFLGERINALIILVMVLISSCLSFFQVYRAENTLKALRKYIRFQAKVYRDNQITELDSSELVPGDIVHFNTGDIIPADIRLLKIECLATNESVLTGESMPVEKKTSFINEKYYSAHQLLNMVLMGTSVSNGSGLGIVTATGRNTIFGKSAEYLKEKPSEQEFQRGIKSFSNMLLKVVVLMTLFVFIVNAAQHKTIIDSLLFALALAVGITPEVLPIVITTALSRGAMRMAKEKVIVKRLSSMEDFGNIDTICCDKTGTLTEGKISLISHMNFEEKEEDKVLLYGLLCNSGIGKTINLADNAIDKAIWEHRKTIMLSKELHSHEILQENEFNFERRRMSVLVAKGKQNIIITKGASEDILKICNYAYINGKNVELKKHLILKIKEKIADYEEKGYKIILIAEKFTTKQKINSDDENNLSLLGMMLFLDPPKATTKEALEKLEKLGVNVKVITGDSPLITKKICEEVNLKIIGRVITGEELSKLNKIEFENYCQKYNIFARITPDQKYEIVKCLNKEGRIAGFLGDGINDAPALHAADIGISVDSASDIAKDAADIILLHKSLLVVANGIIEGRKTFGNITKYMMDITSANYGNMLTVAASSAFLKFIPLLPSQILLNNFLSDIPDLTLSSDNVDSEFVQKPKKWNIKFISRFMIVFGLLSCIFDAMIIIPLLFIFKIPVESFRTAWFVESVLSEIFVMFAYRTRRPFFKSTPGKWFLIATAFTTVLTIGITISTLGMELFGFVNLSMFIWAWIALVLILYFASTEIAKIFFYRKYQQ